MYLRLCSLACLFFCFSACMGSKKASKLLSGHKASIEVDGDLGDWPLPLLQIHSSTTMQAKLANDSQYIYIALRIPDERTQQLAMQLGCSFRIDTLGKNKNKSLPTLSYPIPLNDAQWQRIAEQTASSGKPELLEVFYGQACQDFELINYVPGEKEALRISNLASKSFKAALGFDEVKALQIELRIPLENIYPFGLSYQERLAVSIFINEPPKSPEDEQGDDAFGANRSPIGAMGGANPMMGGGMQPGMQPGMMGNPMNPNAMQRQPMPRAARSLPSIRFESQLLP